MLSQILKAMILKAGRREHALAIFAFIRKIRNLKFLANDERLTTKD
jgi:hypothetical protein